MVSVYAVCSVWGVLAVLCVMSVGGVVWGVYCEIWRVSEWVVAWRSAMFLYVFEWVSEWVRCVLWIHSWGMCGVHGVECGWVLSAESSGVIFCVLCCSPSRSTISVTSFRRLAERMPRTSRSRRLRVSWSSRSDAPRYVLFGVNVSSILFWVQMAVTSHIFFACALYSTFTLLRSLTPRRLTSWHNLFPLDSLERTSKCIFYFENK